MTSNSIETNDVSNRLALETALVPTYNSLTGGSSNPPKFGTLIPNRIFVGGIPSNSETLIFKDRKLNIGHAIRKQQLFSRPDLQPTLLFAGGAIPCNFQNGMTVIPLPSQDYSMFAQTGAPYTTMMLPQVSGNNALYLPQLHSASTTPTAPYTSFAQQTGNMVTHQQFQQCNATNGVTPTVVGQFTSPQPNANAAVISAMAAAIQWPQQASSNQGQINSQQLINGLPVHGINHSKETQNNINPNSVMTQHQAAAVAAALVAQQQNTWGWSPSLQQSQNSSHATSSSQSVLSTVAISTAGMAASTPTMQPHAIQSHQQGLAGAPVGPATYLYSPLTGSGHEFMFFHQTSSPFMGNSTSDYSTDHSAHSSSNLESAEFLNFQCDGTPIGRHTQQINGQFHGSHGGGPHLEGSCFSPYTTLTPLIDIQSNPNCIGQQNPTVAPIHLHQLRQPHQTATFVANPQTHGNQHLVSLVNGSPAYVTQNQHGKVYSTSSLSSVAHPNNNYVNPFTSLVFGNQSIKNDILTDVSSTGSLVSSTMHPNNPSTNIANSKIQGTMNAQLSQTPPATLISSSS